MAEDGTKWSVVRAISGKEKKVQEHIECELGALGLQDFVSQVLIPTEKVYQIRNGKKVSKERNYFPGYVLVEANLVGEVPHIIKNINNVIGFLGAEKRGEPIPLRQTEVNRILGKVDELAESEEAMNIPYIIGETVKVIDGPFNNFHGVIEEINEEKKKLKVMVKIFGRKTPLELGFLQVEKES
jgi:transcriptional antiterminator NusG